MQAERVGEDVGAAVMEELEADDGSSNEQETPTYNSHASVDDSGVGEDGCVPQRVADCCKAIKSHRQKNSRFHA